MTHHTTQAPTFLKLFNCQVQLRPDTVAVIENGSIQYTYAEINNSSTKLANYICSLGNNVSDIVAIQLPQCANHIISLLAVMKSGKAFLSLNSQQPPASQNKVLKQLSISHVIASKETTLNVNAILIPSNLQGSTKKTLVNVTSDDLAYVIQTSGTTGKPKCIQIPHAGLANLVLSQLTRFNIQPGSRIFQFADMCFDASVSEWSTALSSGATLCIPTRTQDKLSHNLCSTCDHYGITHVTLPPSLLYYEDYWPFKTLQTLILAGEVPCIDLWQRISKSLCVINAYGPSEYTVCATTQELKPGMLVNTIGNPIANTKVYLITKDMEPVQAGEVGELVLSGLGLLRGYKNLSSPCIINPFYIEGDSPHFQYCYRTGDLARMNSKGLFIYEGRKDQQIKHHGYRLELEKIKQAIKKCKGILDAHIQLILDDTQSILCAYVIPTTEALYKTIQNDVILEIRKTLNSYEIPKIIHPIRAWPLTVQGKLDVSKLPKPQHKERSHGSEVTREATLKKIWGALIGVNESQITSDSDFFCLGGDSITAMRLRIEARHHGLFVTINSIYDHSTLRGMAIHCQSKTIFSKKSNEASHLLYLPAERWFQAQKFAEPNQWNQWLTLPLHSEVDVERLQTSMDHVFRAIFPMAQPSTAIKVLQKSKESMPLVEQISRLKQTIENSIDIKQKIYYSYGFLISGQETRCVVVVHHLVIDIVSWYLLLDAFVKTYQKGVLSDLPSPAHILLPKIYQHLEHMNWSKELAYWQTYPKGQNDFHVTQPSVLTKSLSLPLHSISYSELLSFILMAIVKSKIEEIPYIALEGHGRGLGNYEDEAAHTIGWWTALYPFYVPEQNLDHYQWQLHVEKALQQLPENGQHFGFLRYACQDSSIRHQLQNLRLPKVCFNYLGYVSIKTNHSLWEEMEGGFQFSRHPKNHLPHPMEINGYKDNEHLHLTILYEKKLFTEETIHHFITTLKNFHGHSYTPLTPAQLGIWQHETQRQAGLTYLVQGEIQGRGKLHHSRLSDAWRRYLRIQPALRMVIRTDAQGAPYQNPFLESMIEKISITYYDGSMTSIPEARHLEVKKIQSLNTGPLIHLAVVEYPHDKWCLLLSLHHILADGWCTHIILNDVFSLYHRHAIGPLQFEIEEYRRWLQKQASKPWLDFWRHQLEGKASGLLNHALFNVHDLTAQSSIESLNIQLSQTETAHVRAFVKEQGITLATIMQLTWGILLSLYMDRKEIVFGLLHHGRPAEVKGIQNAIGVFTQILPVHMSISMNTRFDTLLKQLHKASAQWQDYSGIPLHTLLKEMSCRFDTLLVVENYPAPRTHYETFQLKDITWHEANEFPLSCQVFSHNHIGFVCRWQSNVYHATIVQQILGDLKRLLLGFVQNRLFYLQDLKDYVLAPYRKQYAKLNDTSAGMTLNYHRLEHAFYHQLRSHPKKCLCRYQEKTYSYEFIYGRSNAIYSSLISSGVLATDLPIVAIWLPRSIDWVASIISILSLNGSYLPLDASQPTERIKQILLDAKVSCIITDSDHANQVSQHVACVVVHKEMLLQSPLLPQKQSNRLANVIFTSGTTARPKGVMVSHRALCNRIQWMAHALGITSQDKILHKTSISFDVAGWEVFLPMFIGAEMIIAHEGAQSDVLVINQLLRQHNITLAHFVPSMLEAWLLCDDTQGFPQLKKVVASGEALTTTMVKAFYARFPNKILYNFYGPTEAAIDVTYYRCIPDCTSVPIGQPIDHMGALIVDSQGSPRPTFAKGELLLTGIGLAEGYLHQSAQTAKVFIDTRYEGIKQRYYYTGDIAILDSAQQLHWCGRKDRQIKLHGHRIELTEVESVYADITGLPVRVLYHTSKNACQLIGFFCSLQTLKTSTIQQRASNRLPPYMLLSELHQIENFPINANGKLDASALLAQRNVNKTQDNRLYATSPETATFIGILQETLPQQRINLQKSFIEQGGDSILCIHVINACRTQGIAMSIKDLMQAPTLNHLIEALSTYDGASQTPLMIKLSSQVYSEITTWLGEIEDILPLTPGQQDILMHHLKQSTHGKTYIVHHEYEVPNHIALSTLKKAWINVLSQTPACRAAFVWKRLRQPVQIITKQVVVHWQEVTIDTFELDKILEDHKQHTQTSLLELDKGHLNHFLWIQLPEKTLLVWSHHHILYDGWSVQQLLSTVESYIYAVHSDEAPVSVTDMPRTYLAYLQSLQQVSQSDFWRHYLQQAPITHVKKLSGNLQQQSITHPLTRNLTSQLAVYAREHQLTPNSLILYCFACALSHYLQQSTITLGITSSGRHYPIPNIENAVGLFIQTFPMIFDFSANISAKSVQSKLYHLMDNCMLPVGQIFAQSNRTQNLFDVLYVYENYPSQDTLLKQIRIEEYNEYPLTCVAHEQDTWQITLLYDANTINPQTCENLLNHMQLILTKYIGIKHNA
jgi:amino acid adenylation domain-containing protein/non-ribosomal peptide synthase protein (TIGR01720 family)